MTVMTPMGFNAHFYLEPNDENDPESPLVLWFAPEDGSEPRELCNSFGATLSDFKWMAASLASFHQKVLLDEHGENISTYPSPPGTVLPTGAAPLPEDVSHSMGSSGQPVDGPETAYFDSGANLPDEMNDLDGRS